MSKTGKVLKAAFPHTIPVLTAFLFLGAAFGVLFQSKGYGVHWALLMSVIVYAGSMQFVAVGLLAAGFHPLQAVLMTLMVNARHIFYGVAMLEDFRIFRRLKPYMIFSLTDETFSLFCSAKPPEGIDKGQFFFCLSVLNQIYWVTGSVVGALAGAALPINTTGIDFVMTALFTVIFIGQWRSGKGHTPAMVGVGAAVVCRLLFGPDFFIIPTMALMVAVLLGARSKLEKEGQA